MEGERVAMKGTICVVLVVVYCIVGCKSQEMLSNPYRGERYRTGIFDSIQGIAAREIIEATEVIDRFECLANCIAHPKCQSFNFQTFGNPNHVCELSEISMVSSPSCQEPRPGYSFFYASKQGPLMNLASCSIDGKSCQNGALCGFDNCGRTVCKCQPFNKGKHCDEWTIDVFSCKDVLTKTSYRANMAYKVMIDSKPTDIYCHLTNDICGDGGWTLVIKMDGSKRDTFGYSSPLWSTKESHNLTAGQTGFDNYQTKMPSYWAMPFQKLCVGMKVNNVLKWAAISYNASSLYDVIADGRFRALSITKATWLSLIDSSSLQQNCNEEGFNIGGHARIGIRSNQENDCRTCDSNLGFGLNQPFSCGNKCRIHCNNGDKDTVAYGYIMIK